MALDASYSPGNVVRKSLHDRQRRDMATNKDRINLLELEMRFRRWLWHERLLESLSVEQLEEYACLGILPDPLPDFLPRGKSALDGLDRKRLRQLWEENTRRYVGRGKEELIFFCFHGHWPEQACIEQPCSNARSEEIVSQCETRRASKTE
jgi:hypothetical protein